MGTEPNTMADDVGKLVLRLTVGGLMLFHGIFKITHGVEQVTDALLPTLGQWAGYAAYGVYVGEVVAPVLILIGFWTRLGALILALNMVVAVWVVHTKDMLMIDSIGGWAVEKEAWFFLAAVALLFMGPGRFSVSGGKGRLG